MKIVVSGKHFPMSMMRFFRAAFERLGHEVIKVGPYSGPGGSIPWPGNPHFPQYVDKPDIALPEHLSSYPLAALKSQLPAGVDAVFSFDAGFRLLGKLDGSQTVLYGTDPHALDYRPYLNDYNHFFCAQKLLMGQPIPDPTRFIPLAYDPTVHVCTTPITAEDRPVDVCFIGVMGNGPGQDNAYYKRWIAIHKLAEQFRTFYTQGMIFEECSAQYNQAKIAWNWSSSWDLPMRIWEGAAYGCCVVTNRLPYLEEVGFIDGETCVVYDTLEDLLAKVGSLLETGDWARIAKAGYEALKDATYDSRVKQMLEFLS